MIFVAILSIVLIWLHISSLRVIIKSKTGDAAIKEAEEMEAAIGEETKDLSPVSGPGLISLIIIIVLNLIEIGYFVACVYLFGGLIITIGSSILIGYTIYSLIKFLPNIKKFFNKPSVYLKERTTGFESFLSLTMTSLEIIFCIYILARIILDQRLF